MVVLIAEGTTIVTELLKSNQVEAVVGVSCLSSLERSFPYMAASSIPGMAIPLYNNGCESTKVDVDWLVETLNYKSDHKWDRPWADAQ